MASLKMEKVTHQHEMMAKEQECIDLHERNGVLAPRSHIDNLVSDLVSFDFVFQIVLGFPVTFVATLPSHEKTVEK